MAGWIGTHAFITLGGTVSPPGEVVETWETDGLDGFGARQLGARAPEHVLYPVKDFATGGARNAAIGALMNLQGTIQTIQDDTANVGRCLILSAQVMLSYNVANPVGGINGGGYLLHMAFRVRLKN